LALDPNPKTNIASRSNHRVKEFSQRGKVAIQCGMHPNPNPNLNPKPIPKPMNVRPGEQTQPRQVEIHAPDKLFCQQEELKV